MRIDYRLIEDKDINTLWVMLMHAAHESSIERVKALPELARYVQSWGREGDLGFVALVQQTAVGAAWIRLWSETDQGYAFVDQNTPELAMAVLPHYQRQGIGTKLLQELLSLATVRHPRICLSVRSDNSVQRLYQRLGFRPLEDSTVVNRVGGHSYTMVYER